MTLLIFVNPVMRYTHTGSIEKETIMKRITLALCLSALFTVPVHADTLCQDEAKAVGYNAPVDTLKPCTPQKNVARQAYSDQLAKAREQQEKAQQQDPNTMEQIGQVQIQE